MSRQKGKNKKRRKSWHRTAAEDRKFRKAVSHWPTALCSAETNEHVGCIHSGGLG